MVKLLPPATPLSTYKRNSFLATIAVMALIIIVYEMVHLFGIPTEFTRITIVFVLIFSIMFAAFRYGMWPAVLSAVIANIYIFYALSGPGRNIAPIERMVNAEWMFLLLFFLPGILIGYLRDKINQLIQRERLARQQAEEGQMQLEKILEELPVGVVIARAPDGEMVFSNRHLDQLMGHQIPKHSSLDEYPRNTIIDNEGKPLNEQYWPLYRVLKNHETLVNEEYLYQLDEDTRLRLQVKGTPIYNNDGQMTSGVIIVDDVTAEKELLQRKDDFLSLVSHELKTPITSLKMYTQLLIKQIANNPNYNPINELQKIDNQTQKIHKIINNMIDMATLEVNKDVLQADLVDLVDIIDDVVQDVKNSFPARNIIIHQLQTAPIIGDKDRLAQVISNLTINAIKYSPEHSPVIIDSDIIDNQIQISIQDYGIGISTREKHKIFNRFYQEQQKDGKVYSGLGLGLYFSAEIIKQHQGKIWVESKKGHGSTFYISLPLSRSK